MTPPAPTFDGSATSSVEVFLDLFDNCAVCNAWQDGHLAAHLFGSLKGAALDVARQMEPADRRDVDKLKATLREHFGLTQLGAEMRMASIRFPRDGDVAAFGNRLGALAAEGKVEERRAIDIFLLALPEDIADELRVDDAHRGPEQGHLRSLKTAIVAATRIQHHFMLRRARAQAARTKDNANDRRASDRARDRDRDHDRDYRDRDRYRDQARPTNNGNDRRGVQASGVGSASQDMHPKEGPTQSRQ